MVSISSALLPGRLQEQLLVDEAELGPVLTGCLEGSVPSWFKSMFSAVRVSSSGSGSGGKGMGRWVLSV